MRSETLVDRISSKVTITEEMVVVHSVRLSGGPLLKDLVVDYLRAQDSSILVRVAAPEEKPHEWEIAAIADGDFDPHRGKLVGFCEFAKGIIDADEEPRPVIALRAAIMIHAANMFTPQARRAVHDQQRIIHSRVEAFPDSR